MPRLKAFGYQWTASGDDFFLQSCISSFINGTCLISVATLLRRQLSTIKEILSLNALHTTALSIFTADLTLCGMTIYISSKGTVLNSEPRKNLPKVIGARIFLKGINFCFLIWGVYYLYKRSESELNDGLFIESTKTILILLSTYSTIDAISLFLMMGKCCKLSSSFSNLESIESPTKVIINTWKTRFKKLSHLIGEDPNRLNNVSNIFSSLFGDHLDLSATDIFFAFVILEKMQCMKKNNRSSVDEHIKTGLLQPWMSTKQAAHYMKYAAGAYGWPMYAFKEPFALLGLLKVLLRSRYYPRALPHHIIGDGRLLPNTAVIKMLTGASDQDIIYVSFVNKLYEIPFFVALDHENKKIIISIRGTLSLQDVITDLTSSESEEITLDNGVQGKVHEGMLAAAHKIHEKLFNGILVQTFSTLKSQNQPDREYGIVVTGHSLGAGVAAILTVLLRNHECYKHTQAFCFSPPGGLFSESLAKHSESFICSVVVGDDCVARLGLKTIFETKLQLLRVLYEHNLPKHFVLGGWLRSFVSKLLGVADTSPAGIPLLSDPLFTNQTVNNKDFSRILAEIQEAMNNTEEYIGEMCPLYLPGTVLFIDPKENLRCYTLNGLNSRFQNIPISSNMTAHHQPWTVLSVLNKLSNNYPCTH